MDQPRRRQATFPAELVFTWQSQVDQYAATGEPGVTYEVNHINGITGEAADGTRVANPPVDCLLWRDAAGTLRGILNHYPVAILLYEDAGNVNLWVDPSCQRQGIATALLDAAMARWPIDLDQQAYTPAGEAFINTWEARRRASSPTSTEVPPSQGKSE